MALPKVHEVVTCQRNGIKYQAIRWRSTDDGRMYDTVYHWASNDVKEHLAPDTSRPLAIKLVDLGYEAVKP